MPQKPTYEELEQKIIDLERKLAEYESGLHARYPGQPISGQDLLLTQISVDKAALGVFWIDPQGWFAYVNDTACKWLGYSREELLEMNVSDVDPDFPRHTRPKRWDIYRQAGSTSFETMHRTKSGRLIPVRVDANFLELGDREYLIAYATDITEQKKAREALQENKANQQLLLDNIQTQIWYLQDEHTYGAVNRAHADFFGYRVEDMAFRDMYEFLPHEEAEVCRTGNREVFSRAEAINSEEWVTEASGVKRLLSIRKIPVPDPEDRVRHVVCTAEDITEKRLAELELQKSEERFTLAMEASGEGLWDWDIETGEVYYSPAYAIMLGYSPEEISYNEQFWKNHIHPEDRERCLRANTDCIEGAADSFEVESRMLTKTGSCRWIQGKGKVVARDGSGRATRMVGTHADITGRKQAEENQKKLQNQLLQAQKMESVGVLAGGVAHDFNNLLQVIKSNVQFLEMNRSGSHPDKKRLETIERSVDRSAELIQKLLLFSRKAETKKRPVYLGREIEESVGLLQRTIPKMISLEVKTGENTWPVNADSAQIEQVIMNLGSNAADAMPEGGKLGFEIENLSMTESVHPDLQPGSYVLMTVSDTGCGMDEHSRKHLFDPFYTTKKSGRGTGLGLSSVYGIVKAHKGHIFCDSSPGKGTTFRIYWPAVPDAEIHADEFQAEISVREGKETILVVDDEPEIRELTEEALQSWGYTVLAAESGESALEVFSRRKSDIDLVILDLNMPGMGGIKCMEELLQTSPDIRVLIASGYSTDGQAKESVKKGASGYIAKPYRIKELMAEIRNILDARE